jgi:pyridoxamine 5'-phosphate oxidase
MSSHFTELRKEYETNGFDIADLAADPISQFRTWFDQAVVAQVPQPNAMTIATVNADGQPSARMVLLKDFDEQGFVFYTNYLSRKGSEIAANNAVALVFYWYELHRQVRIEGHAEFVSAAESDEYFAVRPHGSQIGACASPQSQVLQDRAELEAMVNELEQAYPDSAPERPAFWGGYRIRPHTVEFWQGRLNRLHDRLRYRLEGDTWQVERLAP